MQQYKSDVNIAIGGGSPMDEAKAMWLFYEHPEEDFNNLKQKFLDIRKRIVKYPKLGNEVQFVAIPTTSGTGSEVTSFTVITDRKSTRLNSSHVSISYAVFCLKKKKKMITYDRYIKNQCV